MTLAAVIFGIRAFREANWRGRRFRLFPRVAGWPDSFREGLESGLANCVGSGCGVKRVGQDAWRVTEIRFVAISLNPLEVALSWQYFRHISETGVIDFRREARGIS
jgi:hypothetical protein